MMRTMSRFDRLVHSLAETPLESCSTNQYSMTGPFARGNAVRRRNLLSYLGKMDAMGPDTLLVGEAAGYRGCGLTGIPFVSERLLADGISVRADPDRRFLWTAGAYGLAGETSNPAVEVSAATVWAAIKDIVPLPLLWNAFPFHPFDGRRDSNRAPSRAEIRVGAPFIESLIRLFPVRRIIAVGRCAEAALTRLGVNHQRVRHPSRGGRREFLDGLRAILGS
jgi:uracil-DNA glycosylase